MIATPSSDSLSETDSFLQPLMDYVVSATGLMYYTDRRREFAGHVVSRLNELKIADCSAYFRLLQCGARGNAELDQLITLLTIGETHFFRHRELFHALETAIFPKLIEKNKAVRRLRIWSAGCSIGAESYSLSMLLRRRFTAPLADWDVQIIGTDINRDYLARAATGRFDDWALRAVSAEERSEYFLHDGKCWTVKPQFQQGVSFGYHNLASRQFTSPSKHAADFDLILCRNVMIYFSRDAVCKAIKNLHACLATDGWLAVGHAEHNVDRFRSFRTLMFDGAVLYQKQEPHQVNPDVRNDSLGLQGPNGPCQSLTPLETAAVPRISGKPTPKPVSPASEPVQIWQKQEALQEIRSLADRGDLQEALLRCQSYQQSDAVDPAPHFYQALILQQVNDDCGAEQSLKRALYLDRTYVLAHYHLGLLLQLRGQATRAAHSFQNVIKLLFGRSPHEQIKDTDELTVADLERLSTAHLSVLEQR